MSCLLASYNPVTRQWLQHELPAMAWFGRRRFLAVFCISGRGWSGQYREFGVGLGSRLCSLLKVRPKTAVLQEKYTLSMCFLISDWWIPMNMSMFLSVALSKTSWHRVETIFSWQVKSSADEVIVMSLKLADWAAVVASLGQCTTVPDLFWPTSWSVIIHQMWQTHHKKWRNPGILNQQWKIHFQMWSASWI